MLGDNISSKIKFLLKETQNKNDEEEKSLIENKNTWQKRILDVLKQQEDKLKISNPGLKLRQGYSMTFDKSGKIIKDPAEVEVDQVIKTKFYKGHILSQIKTKENNI